MKLLKYINYGIFTIMFLTLNSCDYLDYDESSYNRKEDIFNDFNRSQSFVTSIYSYLPTDFNSIDGAMRSSAIDEAEHVSDLSNIQKFNQGIFSPINPIDNVWENMYKGIRAANVYLLESANQDFSDLYYNIDYEEIMEQYNMYPYEVRFLRAFYYFELIKRYKNVPLITDVLTPDEARNVTQTSFEDIVSFIADECDEIATVLPEDFNNFSSVKETGRATKGAALALKSRVLLYAASPLHNSGNDVSLWQNAAVAANSVIDLNVYTLEGNYNNIVNNLTSSELIFERREGESNGFEIRNNPIGYEGGKSGTCPTQNLVDAYEMLASGLPISDPASGYDPADPYTDRDPRLGETILHNGSDWKGRAVESYVGGADGQPITNATKTGYYLRKYVIEEVNIDPTNTSTRVHTWVLFRLGEVLLNYAEAMNEAYGPENAAGLSMTALDAVNMIRQRVGMPYFSAGLSQTDFREKLRNERRVELAFEDHRFWDVRRWEIGQETKDIYKMKITKFGSNFTFEKQLLEHRLFEERMNLYPIPQSEINKNANLIQNIGW